MPPNTNANDVAIDDYNNRKSRLEQAMTNNSPDKFISLLKAQHNSLTFREELITLHYDEFIELCNAAPSTFKFALMDFSGMNLAEIDLSRLDSFYANFSDSDLTKAVGLTQELLDNSIYVGAILPKGFIPAWTQAKKELVLDAIEQLSLYGKKLAQLTPKNAHEKGTKAVKLAEELTSMINLSPRRNGEFQHTLLNHLRDNESQFDCHRLYGLKRILQNIALCIVSAGVGYLIAGTVNYYSNGTFFFFNQTATQKKIAHIEDQVSHDDKPLGHSLFSLVK